MRSGLKLAALVLTVGVAMLGCKGKSNKAATVLPPPPPLSSEPLPSSLYEPAPAAPQPVAAEPLGPPPAPVVQPQSAPAPVSTAGGQTYRVRPGDTLWSIAKRHYGTGEAWRTIAEANNMSDPRQLKAGVDIVLP